MGEVQLTVCEHASTFSFFTTADKRKVALVSSADFEVTLFFLGLYVYLVIVAKVLANPRELV